jgi:hypothetical protein
MKKLLLLSLSILGFQASAQISTRSVAKAIEPTQSTVYDSTKNFMGANPKAYVGQQLYVLPVSEILRQYGYEHFVVDYKKPTLANKDNTYKCCDSYGSKYEALQGKYFSVVSFIPHPQAADPSHSYESKSFLKLEPKGGGDPIYFEYDSRYEHTFPFLVVGFFEKQKKTEIGKGFGLRGRNWVSNKELLPSDINTGAPVTQFDAGLEWRCIDVAVEERFFRPAYILQNAKKEQLALPIAAITRGDYHFAFPASVAEAYKKSFGADMWSTIVAGKARIGMTKAQATLAWGKPDSINETITAAGRHEQWVYKSVGYLTFDGDKLTAIQ